MSRREDEERDAKMLMERLKDPFWRLSHLYHIKSEATGAIIPFRPYPEQSDVFNAVIRDGFKKIIIPKARRRGMSTGIDVMLYDQALTQPGAECGIVDVNQASASRKLENIVKVSHERLPDFLQEGLVTIKNNDDRLSLQVGSDAISNVYASTGYRGGNLNFLHVSEWGAIQMLDPSRSEEILTGALPAARMGVCIVETTWKGGRTGDLWNLMEQSLTTPEEEKNPRSWRHLFFPWHTDPHYTLESNLKILPQCAEYFDDLLQKDGIELTPGQQRWYQEEAWPLHNNRFGEYPTTLEECFLAPMDGVIYEHEVSRVVAENRVTTVPVEAGLPVIASFDIGRDDAMPIVLSQIVGKEIRIIGYYVSHRESVRFYADYLKSWMAENNVADLRILLPHDGGRKSVESGKTLVEVFQECGFRDVQFVSKIGSVWAGINYVRDVFPYLWFDRSACNKQHRRGSKKFLSLWESLNNYHQAERTSGSSRGMEPVHDAASHGADSLRTLCEAWSKGMIHRDMGRISGDGFDDGTSGSFSTRGLGRPQSHLAGSRRFVR